MLLFCKPYGAKQQSSVRIFSTPSTHSGKILLVCCKSLVFIMELNNYLHVSSFTDNNNLVGILELSFVFMVKARSLFLYSRMSLVIIFQTIVNIIHSSLAIRTFVGVLSLEIKAFNPFCANRNKIRLLFSSAEMFKKPLWQTVWTQSRLLLYGSTLFASIPNLSVMLGNYLQQTTSADDIFRCIFSWLFTG